MDGEKRAGRYAADVSQMLQLETVFRDGTQESFVRQRGLFCQMFPQIEKVCRKWDFDGSLLYCWPGRSRGGALLLMSHQDVVEAPGDWRYPPYSGTIAEGKLWGRGALDIKSNLYCILRAVDEMIAEGYVPAHDIYVASSDREEVGGNDLVANFLREQGVAIDLLLDEGSAIQRCPAPGVEDYAALIAVAEKGAASVRCVARGPGGHPMAPGKNTPLPRLGAFMCRVDQEGLFRPTLDPASAELYRRLSSVLPGQQGAALARLSSRPEDLERVLDEQQLAMLSTTAAFTMAGGSDTPNVIPREAWVRCNIRVAPGRTVAEVMERLGEIAQPYGVELELGRSREPSPITDPCGEAFKTVEAAVNEVFPEYPVLPYLLSGGTDTRHFIDFCPNCLRFTPMRTTPEQQRAIHGVNENIDISVLPRAVDFFRALIRRF